MCKTEWTERVHSPKVTLQAGINLIKHSSKIPSMKPVHIQYRDINPSMSAIALLVSDEHKHFYSNICFQASHFKLLFQGLSLLHTFPLKAMTQPSVLDRLPALSLQQSLVLTPECKSPAGDLLLEVASVFRGCWINAAQSCLKERKKKPKLKN